MGIIGIVFKLQDQTVILKIYDGSKIEVLRGAITEMLPGTEEDAKKISVRLQNESTSTIRNKNNKAQNPEDRSQEVGEENSSLAFHLETTESSSQFSYSDSVSQLSFTTIQNPLYFVRFLF